MKKLNYKSPTRYPGGKQKALKFITEQLPKKRFSEYRDVFLGGGSTLLNAINLDFADSYWGNDLFYELMCFWWQVKDPKSNEALRSRLSVLQRLDVLEKERHFYQIKDLPFVSDYANACKFFFLNRVTFSGTTAAGGFSRSAAQGRFTKSSIERIKPLSDALAGVKLTHLDFTQVIDALGEDVFLFLDPPYSTAKKLYGSDGELHDFDHELLASWLKKTEHTFLMTYDDCPYIRDLYKDFEIIPWDLQYGMNNCNRDKTSKIGKEVFIRNY